MDKVITIYDWWDGPLCGLATYEGLICIYERIFNEAEDDWSNEYYLTPINETETNRLLEDWAVWCETIRNRTCTEACFLSTGNMYHDSIESSAQKRAYRKAAAFSGHFERGFIPINYRVEWTER